MPESTPAQNQPTDQQFQHVTRRVLRYVGGEHSPERAKLALRGHAAAAAAAADHHAAVNRAVSPDTDDRWSFLSEYSSRVVADMKTQFDEVENLRRDLGIMKQLYNEFMKLTKGSLGTLRTQTRSVKQLANAKVGDAQPFHVPLASSPVDVNLGHHHEPSASAGPSCPRGRSCPPHPSPAPTLLSQREETLCLVLIVTIANQFASTPSKSFNHLPETFPNTLRRFGSKSSNHTIRP
jgi:hypothetical protein